MYYVNKCGQLTGCFIECTLAQLWVHLRRFAGNCIVGLDGLSKKKQSFLYTSGYRVFNYYYLVRFDKKTSEASKDGFWILG